MSKKQIDAKKKALDTILTQQSDADTETGHFNADEALCDLLISLGCKKVVEEYRKVSKWYA